MVLGKQLIAWKSVNKKSDSNIHPDFSLPIIPQGNQVVKAKFFAEELQLTNVTGMIKIISLFCNLLMK